MSQLEAPEPVSRTLATHDAFPMNTPPNPVGMSDSTRTKSKRATTTFWSRYKTLINFWLDAFLMINFLAVVWVSVIIRFVFPPAEAAGGYLLWNAGLGQWIEIQFALTALFFAGIVLHVMLHWNWICGVVGSQLWRHADGSKRVMDDGQRTIWGVGLLIVILNIMGVGIALAALAIRMPV